MNPNCPSYWLQSNIWQSDKWYPEQGQPRVLGAENNFREHTFYILSLELVANSNLSYLSIADDSVFLSPHVEYDEGVSFPVSSYSCCFDDSVRGPNSKIPKGISWCDSITNTIGWTWKRYHNKNFGDWKENIGVSFSVWLCFRCLLSNVCYYWFETIIEDLLY